MCYNWLNKLFLSKLPQTFTSTALIYGNLAILQFKLKATQKDLDVQVYIYTKFLNTSSINTKDWQTTKTPYGHQSHLPSYFWLIIYSP